MENLRKVWVVIHGEEAPAGEVNNANLIADYLKQNLNLVRVFPANTQALELLARFVNFVLVGGPLANEWAFKLNDQLNPKYNIQVVRERGADETWRDYVLAGGIVVSGFIVDASNYPLGANMGILGKGDQSYVRVRSLEIHAVGGTTFEDTCVMGKAFREGATPGLYSTTYAPAKPEMDTCPETMAYTKKA